MRELLPNFVQPSHYLGTEINAVHKDQAQILLRWGLAFPDMYDVGMSYLGQKIIYNILNQQPHIWAERVFAPHPDVAACLRRHASPLCTLESDTPLVKLDILGFSLTHELCYTTVLYMLELAGIPIWVKERGHNYPLIMASGGGVFNPEPVADFFDLFLIGDGEDAALEISEILMHRAKGNASKIDLLQALGQIPGVYIPSFFQEAGPSRLAVSMDQECTKVQRRIIADINQAEYPVNQVVPFGRAVHDRFTLEIARGCTRGCRFCQAGMVYRPVRERSLSNCEQLLAQGLDSTGYEELSFLSLSSGDYSRLEELFVRSFARCQAEQVAFSLPSLRAGSISPELMSIISRIRRTGITLAPEAGSQRLRNVINKNISQESIVSHVQKLFNLGWHRVKLYFMIGLPWETWEDIKAVLDLCTLLQAEVMRQNKGGRMQITASLSPFIPKPHTPFQWADQEGLPSIYAKINWLKKQFKPLKNLRLTWHQPEMSMVEGIFSRGGRNLSQVLYRAYQLGDVFSAWKEYFSFPLWQQAFAGCGLDPERFLQGPALDEQLAWSHIASGVSENFLKAEYHKAREGIVTEDCRTGECNQCGVCGTREADGAGQGQAQILPRLDKARKKKDQQHNPNGFSADASRKERHMRVWFSITYPASYFSQLVLQKVLERIMRRASLPLTFSSGFNPAPLISFGRALPVGVSSLQEWFNIYLRRDLRQQELLLRLNQHTVPGLDFFEAKHLSPSKKQSTAELEIFELQYLCSRENALHYSKLWFMALERNSIPWMKNNKHGRREIDLRPFIFNVQQKDTARLIIDLHWGHGYINPLHIVQAINPELTMQDFALCKTRQIMPAEMAHMSKDGQ